MTVNKAKYWRKELLKKGAARDWTRRERKRFRRCLIRLGVDWKHIKARDRKLAYFKDYSLLAIGL